MIQFANIEDLDQIVDIENQSFETDKLSRRNLKYLLTKANSSLLVKKTNDQVQGYALILYNSGTSHARLYSLVVDKNFRGQGVGKKLLKAAEKDALGNECVTIRLEVREDNEAAIKLYTDNKYKQFDLYTNYYEDHMTAIRLEKYLVPHLKPKMVNVPFYKQTLDFTCGPSSLMMAMKGLDKEIELNRKNELRIWRESTTIYMTSGHGGCGPYGLALSAYNRGFDVELYVNDKGILFIGSVRSPEKREVMRLVQEDQLGEIKKLPIKINYGVISGKQLIEKSRQGLIPIVLISSYRIYREKNPHWVVVTGFDERYIYVHDSFVDYEENRTSADSINMPILLKDFERMSKYGKSGQKAVILIKKRESNKSIIETN